jgi:hypothetical protein
MRTALMAFTATMSLQFAGFRVAASGPDSRAGRDLAAQNDAIH